MPDTLDHLEDEIIARLTINACLIEKQVGRSINWTATSWTETERGYIRPLETISSIGGLITPVLVPALSK